MSVDQELYRTLLEALPDPVAIYDIEGRVTHVNPAFVETFGWPKEELLGKRVDFVPEENQTETQWAIQEVFKNGRVPFLDTRRYTKSGQILDVQLSASLYNNEDDEPQGIIVILRDVTTHKQTEAARRESEERYHTILSNTDEGYYEVDTNGVFTFCNDALVDVFGWPKEDLIGISYEKIMDEATAVAVYETFSHVYKTGAPGSGENWPIIGKDGSVRYVNSSISLIKNAQGKPIGCRGIIKDMTAQLQAQQALNQFKLGIERSQDAIFLTDINGTITYINPAFTQIYGFTEEETLGKTPRILKSGEMPSKFYNNLWGKLLDKEVVTAEVVNKTKDGRLLNIAVSNNPIQDENGQITGFLSIQRDITARKQAEEALQRTHEQLEARIEERTTELIDANVSLTEEIVERTVAEEELQARAESLAIINRVADTVYQALDQETVMQQAIEAIAAYTDAPSLALFLLDEESESLNLLATKGFDEHTMEIGAKLPLKGSLSGLTVQLKDIVMSNDMAHDDRLEPQVKEELLKQGLKNAVSLPILFQDDVLGVVNLVFAEPPKFTPQAKETLLSIGKTIGLAISNAQYITQIQTEIRERQEAEEALLASEIQTRSIISAALDAVIAIDADAIVTTWNPQAEAIFGWSADEIIGQKLTDFIVPKRHREGHTNGMERYLTTGVKHVLDQRIEIEALHRDGHEFPIELSISEIKIGDQSTFSAFARDITRRKESEVALRQREEESRQFQQKLQALQEVSIELSRVSSLEALYEQVIVLAKERLDFDRIGLLLYDEENNGVVGTFGTNAAGEVKDERHLQMGVNDANLQMLANKEPAQLFEDAPLWDEGEIVGQGWNASAGIWVDDRGIGWLVADNLTTQAPPEPYQLEIMTLYGLTVGNLINRKQAEQQIRESLARRGQQVSVATRVAQEIATALDIDDLYERVVTLVKEEFAFYHVQLLRYDPARDKIALVLGYGEVGEKMLAQEHALPVGVGLIGTAVTSGEAMLIADVTKDPHWQPNALLPNTKSELAIPIKLRDEVLGVLDVQSDEIGGLDREDQLILEGLCGQIASAIESTNLRQEMAVRLDELSTLQRQMTREGWTAYQASRQQSLGYLFDQQSLQPIALETAVTNGNAKKEGNGRGDSAPEIIAPLQVRGETFGVLGVSEGDELPLTEDERAFLDAISLQVAEALEAARLFEQTQESLAEQERLASELETVAEVSAAASTILETDKLLQAVVDLAKNSFNLYHAQVYLYDDKNGFLILRAGSDTVGRLMTLEGQEINPHQANKSPIARAANERQGIIFNNIHEDPDFKPHPLLPNTKSELVVPFIVGENVIGVMDLQSDKPDYFTAEDMQIQNTLGAQIAIAVQNATLYAEQVAATEKLREVDRLKSEFLASMSHELRTPLNSIIGFADVILEGLDGPLTDRMEEDISLIKGSGIHLRELIGDILDMSKIEAGRMELRYESLDPVALVKEVVATNQPLAEEKKLYLKASVSPDIPNIEADRTRLRQVFYNIISNAIKFTQKGGVTIDLKMRDDLLYVAIRDTGIGIKQEDIAIVFEQFRQIDGSLQRQVGGTGLGMPITKNLVELHGGEIWAESTMGMGTTFFFTIPRYKSPPRGDAAKNIPTL